MSALASAAGSGLASPAGSGLDRLLRAGIAAARAGQAERARGLLRCTLAQDERCVPAWLWLSSVAAGTDEQEHCLEQVLRLDPGHRAARRGLAWLRAQDSGGGGSRAGRRALPAAAVDELLRAGVAAARSRQAERARELLGRVVEVDETDMSAWLWLSYVAESPHEQQCYLGKVLSLVGAEVSPGPSLAIARPYPATWPATPAGLWRRRAAIPAPAWAPARAPGQARSGGPARPLPQAPLWTTLARALRGRAVPMDRAAVWLLTALAYLAGIVLAESLITFADPRVGLVAHGLLLVALLLHSARVVSRQEQNFLVCLAFAPLIRMLSLSLPLAGLPILYWYLITSLPLFAAVLVGARALGYSWRELGLHLRGWPLQLLVGLSGLLFGAVEYFILRPDPLSAGLAWAYLWRPALILLVCTGLLEEMIFRGLLQHAAVQVLAGWGVFYVALVFAALHIGYRSLLDVLFVLAVGFFFGWVVQRTRSLLGVTLSHGLTNVVLFLVMPFLVG